MNELSPSGADRLLEALPLPMLLFGPDKRLRAANAAFVEFHGLPRERLPPGLPLVECARLLAFRGMLGPGDPAEIAIRVAAIDRSRPSRRLLRPLDGRVIDLHTAPTPDGGFLTLAVDITTIFAAQGEAAGEARRLSEVVAHLTTGVAAFGADRRLAYVNPAYPALIGLPKPLLHEGMTIGDIVRLLDERGEYAALSPAEMAQLAERATGEGPPVFVRRRPNGQLVESRVKRLSDGGTVLEVSDVTARQAAEDDARRRAGLLDSILEALPVGICVYDAGHRVVMLNHAHHVVLGVPGLEVGTWLPGLLRQQAEEGIFGPGDPETLVAEQMAFRMGGRGEQVRRRRDGRVFVHRVAPLPDGGHVSVVTDITALTVAEGEAQMLAERLSAMVERLPFGTALFDRDRRLVAVNGAGLRMGGLDAAAAPLGTPIEAMLAEQVARGEYGPEEKRRALGIDCSRAFSNRRVRPDGTVLDVQSLPMPDGGFLVTFGDVTPIVRAEEQARAQAAMLRAMIDNTEHGVLLFDRDERLVAMNAGARRIEDFADDERLEGMTWREVLAHVARRGGFGAGGVTADTVLAMAAGSKRRYRRVRDDGTVVDVAVRPMPDGGFVVSLSNVTRLVAAEQDAARRADLLRGILDNMAVGVFLYDPEDRLLAFNDAGLTLTGLTAKEAVPGARFCELVAILEARGEFLDGMTLEERIARASARRQMRYTRTRPDGTVVDVAYGPMPDGGFIITLADVTRVARAEEESSRRAALLQGMIDNAAYGVALYDANERFVAANALACEFIGLAPEELRAGASIVDLLALQVERGEMSDESRAALAGADRSRPHGHRRVRRDGTILDVESKPMPDGGFVITYADVTRLVQAEEDACRRAAMQAAMLDNMRHGIVLFDAESRVLAANPLAAELTGLSPDTYRRGATFAELRAAQVAAGEFTSEEAAARGYETLLSMPPRYVRERPNGMILEVTTDRTPDGLFVRTFTDVTEDRRIRARLIEAEAEARRRATVQAAMLDHMRPGVALLDAEGRLIAANPLAARLAGLPEETLRPGTRLSELRAAQVAAGEFTEASALARGDGLSQSPRYTRTRPDGTVVEVTTDRTPEGLFVRTFTDVTEDRRIRADLEAARAEAEAAAIAKSRFLAAMTHELRTPLNAVIGFADLLKKPQDAATVAEFGGLIADAGRELLGLIDQILDVARSETAGLAMRRERVALRPLLEQALAAKCAAAQAARLTLVADFPAALPDAEADAGRLAEVVHGLLSNALKFTPARGTVTLSACVGVEGGVDILIADTGIGIAPDALPLAFEPFAQLDAERARRYAGSGIGLYLARSIAGAMGMRLTLDSVQGEGTTATLTIPPDRCLPPEETPA